MTTAEGREAQYLNALLIEGSEFSKFGHHILAGMSISLTITFPHALCESLLWCDSVQYAISVWLFFSQTFIALSAHLLQNSASMAKNINVSQTMRWLNSLVVVTNGYHCNRQSSLIFRF